MIYMVCRTEGGKVKFISGLSAPNNDPQIARTKFLDWDESLRPTEFLLSSKGNANLTVDCSS